MVKAVADKRGLALNDRHQTLPKRLPKFLVIGFLHSRQSRSTASTITALVEVAVPRKRRWKSRDHHHPGQGRYPCHPICDRVDGTSANW